MKKSSEKNNFYDIDIAIATKNGYQQLEKCVLHIVRGKDNPKKIIIVDNNSKICKKCKKSIEEICKKSKIGIDYVYIPNIGLSNARNEAIKWVDSPYFAFIDQDEYIHILWITKIKEWLREHPNVDVVSGPKKSSEPRTYWKKIWDFLYKESFSYEGLADFVTSSNTCYKTDFIRKNKLKFDSQFIQSSEDVVFSHLLNKAGASVYYSGAIWLEHDFRSNFRAFFTQWFKYGISLYLFETKYLKGKNFWQKFASNLKIPSNIELYFIPGFIILNLALLFGFTWGLLTVKNDSE